MRHQNPASDDAPDEDDAAVLAVVSFYHPEKQNSRFVMNNTQIYDLF